jgi:hypothetical protein
MPWPYVVLHPRIICWLFHEPAVRLFLSFLLRMRIASVFLVIAIRWRHIGCSASHRVTLLMSGSVHDAMSPRVTPWLWLLLHDLVYYHVRGVDIDLNAYGPCPPLSLLKLCYSPYNRIFHVLEEFVTEVGAVLGRGWRLEARRIRSRPFRDRPRDVVWLDFAAPHSVSTY